MGCTTIETNVSNRRQAIGDAFTIRLVFWFCFPRKSEHEQANGYEGMIFMRNMMHAKYAFPPTSCWANVFVIPKDLSGLSLLMIMMRRLATTTCLNL